MDIGKMKREAIDKGWSEDKKFCVTDESGTRYLLRISPAERYEGKKTEFELMKQAAALGVSMCIPIDFGMCGEGVYSLQSWIDGCDAEALMPGLTEKEQYDYGFEAGRMLRLIHSIPAPETQQPWGQRFGRKLDRKLAAYENCSLKYEKGQLFIDRINAGRCLLTDRPQSFQHGDFHIGNMMLDRERKLHIIDFNRSDFGDPWEEFNRIVWSAQCASAFACGTVDGYFDREVPAHFWELLALYISSNILSSLPWAIPFGEEEIAVMYRQAEDILRWYDDMRSTIPSWYRSYY